MAGDDESFLADLTDFLNSLQPPTELQTHDGIAIEATALQLDNDQLLAESEALLASCDGSTSTASQVSIPRDHQSADAEGFKALEDQRRELRNKQAAKRRRKYHNKLKNERQTLQEQELTLSEELSELQRTRRKKTKLLQVKRVLDPVWEAIAARQMEGRSVAEEQQKRLKSAVASRQKVIREVGEMMRQQLCGVHSPQMCGANSTTDANLRQLDADDIALFEDYLQDIDTVYAQTDEAFRGSGLEENPRTSYKVGPVRRRDGDVEFLESLDVLLVQHDFEQTCNAMWRAMVHVHRRQDRQQYRGVTDPDNTIAVKLRIPCPRDSGEPVDMLVHLVTRRYVEAGRVVIVWRAMTEGDDEFSGMHSDEFGWCVIRPNERKSTLPTVMATFARFVPMTVATHFEDKAHVDQFAKFVVTSGEEDGAEISRMMEALLLDDPVRTESTLQRV
ncbi:hypothetical protein PR003_g21840 [Phytophthora rubi]|uniref:BZIP domain-containing protein n=1 Tax=Phytophthora rubi TaxID=129364 RepID=A0A6A3JRV6_9STRA|nr:hypothetical protein PR001_g19940 [Phytophthora rubi]KAE9040208.1 hypothetical protein PR002_g5074 [Phytophthora rubi]KAE9304088.1 hypothetical protein PR003_g21840 [Phytophthora rubi]